MKFSSIAREDQLVIRLKRIDKRIQSEVNVEELIEECSNMLLARRFRAFSYKTLTDQTVDLTDWSGEVASHQSRLADIRVFVIDKKLDLEDLIEATKKHLAVAYPDYFKTGKGTASRVGDKKELIDTALYKPLRTLSKLRRLLAVTDEVYRALKDNHFSNVLVKQIFDSKLEIERI